MTRNQFLHESIKPKIVVSNGCHRFFMYQTALAYQQAGMLKHLIVGGYLKNRSLAGLVQSPAFRSLFGASWSKRLLGRRQEGIDPSRVVSLLLPDVLERLDRSRIEASFRKGFFSYWSMRTFGRLSRKYVRDLDLFHVRSGYGRGALAQARAAGAVCLVDHSIADPIFIKAILAEEASRWGLPLEFPDLHWLSVSQDLEEADHILVNSEFVRETIMASRGIPRDRITVLTLGVDLERFSPAPEAPNPSEPFRLLFVGEIGLRKGVLYLLDAFKKLNLPQAELILVGEVAEIESLLAGSGVKFRHIPVLPHDELVAYYRASSVFVFPSLIEGSARVIQEAMACGCPVITTPNSGSIVRDGLDGFVVPIREVEALYERILELYQDPEKRVEMGRAARAAAERAFPPHRYRDGLFQLLGSLFPQASRKLA